MNASGMGERGRTILRRHAASGLRVALGLVLGAVFMSLVLRTVDVEAVYDLIRGASLLPVLVALLAFALDFVLRAVRFSWMLRQATGRPVPFAASVAPYIASFGVSDILPLRLGDAFRILWFHRRFAIPVGTLAGTMIVERVFDLLTIVFLCAVSLAFVDASGASVLLRGLQFALLLSGIAGVALVFGPSLLTKLLRRLARRVPLPMLDRAVDVLEASADAMRRLGSRRRIVALAVLSSGLWLLESVAMIGAWVSLGGGYRVFEPFLAFSFSTLGTMVPSLPGHFGTFEFFGMQAFRLGGVEETLAAAVLLLAHLIIWLPTALFALAWLLFGAAGSGLGLPGWRTSEPRTAIGAASSESSS